MMRILWISSRRGTVEVPSKEVVTREIERQTAGQEPASESATPLPLARRLTPLRIDRWCRQQGVRRAAVFPVATSVARCPPVSSEARVDGRTIRGGHDRSRGAGNGLSLLTAAPAPRGSSFAVQPESGPSGPRARSVWRNPRSRPSLHTRATPAWLPRLCAIRMTRLTPLSVTIGPALCANFSHGIRGEWDLGLVRQFRRSGIRSHGNPSRTSWERVKRCLWRIGPTGAAHGRAGAGPS